MLVSSEPITFATFLLFSLLGGLMGVAYLMPTILAAIAREKSLPVVMLVNVLFGWTIVGYVIAIGLAGFFAEPGEKHYVRAAEV